MSTPEYKALQEMKNPLKLQNWRKDQSVDKMMEELGYKFLGGTHNNSWYSKSIPYSKLEGVMEQIKDQMFPDGSILSIDSPNGGKGIGIFQKGVLHVPAVRGYGAYDPKGKTYGTATIVDFAKSDNPEEVYSRG